MNCMLFCVLMFGWCEFFRWIVLDVFLCIIGCMNGIGVLMVILAKDARTSIFVVIVETFRKILENVVVMLMM